MLTLGSLQWLTDPARGLGMDGAGRRASAEGCERTPRSAVHLLWQPTAPRHRQWLEPLQDLWFLPVQYLKVGRAEDDWAARGDGAGVDHWPAVGDCCAWLAGHDWSTEPELCDHNVVSNGPYFWLALDGSFKNAGGRCCADQRVPLSASACETADVTCSACLDKARCLPTSV